MVNWNNAAPSVPSMSERKEYPFDTPAPLAGQGGPDPLDPFGTLPSHDTDDQLARQQVETDCWLRSFTFNRYQVQPGQPLLGGMGSVYTAFDQTLRRPVALKQLRGDFSDHPYWRNRFRQEAMVNAYLDRNLGVIPVHDAGELPNGRPFFTMPLSRFPFAEDSLDDEPFASRLLTWHPLSKAIRRFHDLLREGHRKVNQATIFPHFVKSLAFASRTLHSVHRQGIVHLDLKPGNVLLSNHRNGCWLIDWGLAACLGGLDPARETTAEHRRRLCVDWTLLTPGQPLGFERRLNRDGFGTSSYLCPELADGAFERIGVAADIFALGGILYAILMGRPPYVAATPEETLELARRCDAPPPDARQHLPKVPKQTLRKLEDICRKAMQKDPEQRYRSAKDMAHDISEVWGGKPGPKA